MGAFGRLHAIDGSETLIETVTFDDRSAVVIDLADGARRLIDTAAHRHQFTALPMEVAAELAGMPVPVTLKVGDMHRRVDPFHSERHLNQRFRALTSVIYDRALPCGFALLLSRIGQWKCGFDDPCREAPEQTAAGVAEALTRFPALSLEQALRDELALAAAVDTPHLEPLLDQVGWNGVLGDLDAALAEYADAPPYPAGLTSQRTAGELPTAGQPPAAAPSPHAGGQQLTLI